MEHLFKTLRQNDFPADFLLARLRGRAARVRLDWHELAREEAGLAGQALPAWLWTGPEAGRLDAAWQYLAAEKRWVYGRMNRGLRRDFAPLFFFLELPALVSTLRLRENGEAAEMLDRIGALSLLAEKHFAALRRPGPAQETLADLFTSLAGHSNMFLKEPAAGPQSGPALEGALLDGFFGYVAKAKISRILRLFFRGMADCLNLLLLQKVARWHPEQFPVFLEGGSFPAKRLHSVALRGSQEEFFASLGLEPGMSPARLEGHLLLAILRKLQKEARLALEAEAPVIAYLFEQYLFAQRYSLYLRRAGIVREHLPGELAA